MIFVLVLDVGSVIVLVLLLVSVFGEVLVLEVVFNLVLVLIMIFGLKLVCIMVIILDFFYKWLVHRGTQSLDVAHPHEITLGVILKIDVKNILLSHACSYFRL